MFHGLFGLSGPLPPRDAGDRAGFTAAQNSLFDAVDSINPSVGFSMQAPGEGRSIVEDWGTTGGAAAGAGAAVGSRVRGAVGSVGGRSGSAGKSAWYSDNKNLALIGIGGAALVFLFLALRK